MIFTILRVLYVVGKKAIQLHDVGADAKILQEIHDVAQTLKEIVDGHHKDHKHLVKADDFD